jgi:hypothetical protein
VSILIPGEAGWSYAFDAGGKSDCFLCYDPVGKHELAIYWHGATGDILFHRGCAASFVFRLARDCWEIDRHENPRD